MSTEPNLNVDNRHAQIGTQLVAERMFFGGENPTEPEREILRERISKRFGYALERGELGIDERIELGAALERLLGPRVRWIETPDCRIVDVEVKDDARADLRLPLELLRAPNGAGPVLVRCSLADTTTIPQSPRPHPEGGRIVLATNGSVPDAAMRQALCDVCETGLHLSSDSQHDRRRGAFDPDLDHLPHVSLAALRRTLGPHDDRPGATVLVLACQVRDGGLGLHDDSGREALVGPEALAGVLASYASHLRLVVLLPVAEEHHDDTDRVALDVAMALHHRGLASVVAPRVPMPTAVLPGATTALFEALLGDARIGPRSLESALVHANGYLDTLAGPNHLGLRLWARTIDGDDTRPLVIRPYRGLLSFEPEHERFYLGRAREAQTIVERLGELDAGGRPRFLLLVGASGVGKSSLAKAGVVPRLVDEGWTTVLTRPALHSGVQLESLVDEEKDARRVVVVDQLEEVLTETDSHYEATDYLQRLWALASEDGVAVLGILRIDALDKGAEVRIDQEHTLEQLVPGPHVIFVQHLDGKALRRVIEEPARNVGLEVDGELVDRLCTEALAEPGALPMLELVLDELWLRRKGRRMVAATLEGGLVKRLTDYADRRVSDLPSAQRIQAQRILARLATGPVIELATWRRRSTVESLRPLQEQRRQDFDAALAALVEARLVVRGSLRRRDPGAGDDVVRAVESVELAHELLLRQWDALGEWIEDAAPRLAAVRDLERWVKDRRDHGATLLTSEQLAYIERAKLSVDGDDLSEPMVDLITVSQRAVHRTMQIRRAVLMGVGAITLSFAGLSWWALEQRSTALAQADLAREQTALSDKRLDQALVLASELIYETLPKLERHPELRDIRKELIEELQQMLAEFGVTDSDIEAQSYIAAAHLERGDQGLHGDDIVLVRREYQAAHRIADELARKFPTSPDIQRDLSIVLNKLGQVEVQVGNLAAARDLFQRDLAIAESLAEAAPKSTQAQQDLAASLNDLGALEVEAGNVTTARLLFQRLLDLRETLAKSEPNSAWARRDLARTLNDLGDLEMQTGNLAAARELLRRELGIREASAKATPEDTQALRDLSISLNGLGALEERAGNRATAHGFLERDLEISEKLAKAAPDNEQAQRDLFLTLRALGNLAIQASDFAAARDLFGRNLDITEKLAKADPDSALARRDLSLSLNALGDLELQAGELTAARELFGRDLEITERLAELDPDDIGAQRDLSDTLNSLGELELQAGEFAAARKFFERDLEIAEKLASSDTKSVDAQSNLSFSLNALADLELQDSNLAAARELLERSLEITTRLAKANLDSPQAQRNLSLSLSHLGDLELQAGNLSAARDFFLRDLEISEWLAKIDLDGTQAQRDLSLTLNALGNLELQAGNIATARDFLLRDFEIAETLAKADPKNTQDQRSLSLSVSALGVLEVRAGNLATARELALRDLDIAETLAKATPKSPQALRDLSLSLNILGDIEAHAGNIVAARELFRRDLDIMETLAKAAPKSERVQHDLLLSKMDLGALEVQASNLAAARPLFEDSLAIAHRATKAAPTSRSARKHLSLCLNGLGDLEVQVGNLTAARELFRRSLEIAEELAKTSPDSASAQRHLSVVLNFLGSAELQASNPAAARNLLQRALRLAERLAKADPHDARAAFDVVLSQVHLRDLAKQEDDTKAIREVVIDANRRLDAMDRKGQLTGFEERQDVRELFKAAAEDLVDD